MTWRLERRKGKDVLVVDTRPSKAIRRAKNRIQRRMMEIRRAFKARVEDQK